MIVYTRLPAAFFLFSGSSNHHRLNQAAVDLIWEAHTSDAEKEEAKKKELGTFPVREHDKDISCSSNKKRKKNVATSV